MRTGILLLSSKRTDIDSICKLCADALNGIGYHDDAQIVDLRIIKKYGESDEIKMNYPAASREEFFSIEMSAKISITS